jgi:hypothetical protein
MHLMQPPSHQAQMGTGKLFGCCAAYQPEKLNMKSSCFDSWCGGMSVLAASGC